VASALWAIISGRVEEVEPLLRAAEDALAATAGEPPEASPGRTPGGLANPPAMIALLRAELARQRGDADRTIQFAQQGLALADADDGYIQYMVRWGSVALRRPGAG
jgi:hypothetical protein